MNSPDPNTLDLTQQKICLAEGLRFWPVHERGRLVYRIEAPTQRRFFRVGYAEYVLLSLLDGRTTLPQACGLAAARLGRDAPDSATATEIVRWLLKNGLASVDDAEDRVGSTRRERAGSGPYDGGDPYASPGKWNPFWIKLPIPGAAKLMERYSRWLTWTMSRPCVLIGISLITLALLLLAANSERFFDSAGGVLRRDNWIWLALIWLGLKLIHELGHAIACCRQGGEISQSGVVMILLAPLAYVDVTSCWRIDSRWSRIAVSSAGIYVELVVAALAMLVWPWVESPWLAFQLQNVILMAGASTLLFNANPLMRFDGYYLLADLTEITNLYWEGSAALRRVAGRVVFGEEHSRSQLSGWRRPFTLAYGLAALLWRVTICVSLAIAASVMFAGAGIALTTIGLLVWLGQPLGQLGRHCRSMASRDPDRLARGLIVSLCLIALTWIGICEFPFPTAIRCPAVARYLPETMVRSRADGFVKAVHVRDSQHVQKGDLLLELKNPELRLRLRQLDLKIAQQEIRFRQAAQQHDAALQSVLRQSILASATQREQIQRQVDALQIRSPRDGRVVGRNLPSKVGRHVLEGDPLLWVAEPGDKEFIAVIGQEEVESVRRMIGETVRIRDAGRAGSQGRLARIAPRASDDVPDQALTATSGGPLAVRHRSNEASAEEGSTPRLLSPHFIASIEVDDAAAANIPAGMRLETSFGLRREPIATRARTALRRLWHAAHQTDKE